MAPTLIHGFEEQGHWLVEQDNLEIFHAWVLGRRGFGLVVRGTCCNTPCNTT